jgi:serine/threonine protein kinase
MGVSLFYIACGSKPFKGQNIMKLIHSLKNEEVNYEKLEENTDQGFVNFLKKLLEKDQHKRATITDLINDDWLNNRGKDRLSLYYNEADYDQI